MRYIPDDQESTTLQLLTRTHLATRFEVGRRPWASENFKVMNYGPGGMINSHNDGKNLGVYEKLEFYWPDGTRNQAGPRLATAMYTLR